MFKIKIENYSDKLEYNLEEFEQGEIHNPKYASGARDCMNIVRDEINKYKLNNIDGRNDEIIYRLQKAIEEIVNITGVEYEQRT